MEMLHKNNAYDGSRFSRRKIKSERWVINDKLAKTEGAILSGAPASIIEAFMNK
jgi:hypothetical protein